MDRCTRQQFSLAPGQMASIVSQSGVSCYVVIGVSDLCNQIQSESNPKKVGCFPGFDFHANLPNRIFDLLDGNQL